MNQPEMPSRALLAGDPHRPRYHFLPPANWMNDPNGLIQWRGRFHLFYQYNPLAPVFGTIHWGHAMSADLVHWQDLPLAMSPMPGTADESGVWSGCALDTGETASVVYTAMRKHADGTRSELPCLATSSDDDLRTWQKFAGNPVIASPPADLDVLGFRDHSVWHEDGAWFQAIGSGIRGVGGTVLVYRSADLRQWEYVGPLCIGDGQQTGEMWECPDLFPLGDRHVLMVSPIPLRKTLYFTGDYRAQRFTPAHQGVVDAGGYLYAPQSFFDARGRRIMFGWLREGRDEAAQRSAGWAGVMSLPRVLTARRDGRLGVAPAAELEALRGRHVMRPDVQLGSLTAPGRASGDALEIQADVDPGTADQISVWVRCSPDGREKTGIVYDVASGALIIDRSQSSLDATTHGEAHSTQLELESGEPLRLRIFVDHSVIEVFANERVALASRVYPTLSDSLGVELLGTSAAGGSARVRRLDVWEMASIWPD